MTNKEIDFVKLGNTCMVEVEEQSDRFYCKAKGRIGGEAAINFYREMKPYFDKKKSMMLDMGEVDFIDSSGLGSLVAINISLVKAEKELSIVNCPENLMSFLKITNLDRIIDVTA